MAAVVLFLVFDFSALALNFWLTSKIERQAIGINLAGRQRMLSQRMAKVLLQLEDARQDGTDPSTPLAELKVTHDLFDLTLQGFSQGHQTFGGANEEIFLEAVNGEEARNVLVQANAVWLPYREMVLAVIQGGAGNLGTTLPPAATYAKQHNLEILGLMNRLTTELERLTKAEAVQVRIYQGAAFILALINFIGAFFLYSRRIGEATKNLGLLDEILNKVSASVMVLGEDGATIIMANRTARALFCYQDDMVGRRLDTLVSGKEGNMIGLRKDGTSFLAITERTEAHLGSRKLYIETILDITQQRMTEEHLSSLAYHDLLTKLPNRLHFDDRLNVEVDHAQRKGQTLCVLFIDLDGFKSVNDTYGHEVGDLLLQDVAVRLMRCLRESDTISRRGGDEFTAIINDVGSRENCAKVAQVIVSQLAKPFSIKTHELRVGASVGISVYPTDGVDGQLLLSRADEAMYKAKQEGRGRYCFYSMPSNEEATPV